MVTVASSSRNGNDEYRDGITAGSNGHVSTTEQCSLMLTHSQTLVDRYALLSEQAAHELLIHAHSETQPM